MVKKHCLFMLFALFCMAFSFQEMNAKTVKFFVGPEPLTEQDSLVLYACPAFSKGVMTYQKENDVLKAIGSIKDYIKEHPLEGEYEVVPVDQKTRKIVCSMFRLNHDEGKVSSTEKALKYDAEKMRNGMLFAILGVVSLGLGLFLFSRNRMKMLCRILAIPFVLVGVALLFLAVLAIGALAFKYIFIAACGVGAVCLLLFVFGGFLGGGRKESANSEKKHGWASDGGVVYMSKDAAEKNSSDPNHVRPV